MSDNDADLVVLAGDLARPREALAWATRLGQPALYVPGNHECYGGSLGGTVEELRQLCAGTDVRLLDNEAVIVGGVRALGSTLWTDFLPFGADEQRAAAMRDALRFNRDYARIRIASGSETVFTSEAAVDGRSAYARAYRACDCGSGNPAACGWNFLLVGHA